MDLANDKRLRDSISNVSLLANFSTEFILLKYISESSSKNAPEMLALFSTLGAKNLETKEPLLLLESTFDSLQQ